MEINLVRLLVEATVGIILMTAFSYLVSLVVNECFKEPELLELLLRAKTRSEPKKFPVAGWTLHYLTGILFAFAYEVYWQSCEAQIDWVTTGQLGLASGILGIVVWKIAYAIAPKKPNIDYRGFYLQLVLAHLLFALGVAAVYMSWKT